MRGSSVDRTTLKLYPGGLGFESDCFFNFRSSSYKLTDLVNSSLGSEGEGVCRLLYEDVLLRKGEEIFVLGYVIFL